MMAVLNPNPACLEPGKVDSKIRNPNIEIRNKFEIQKFENNKQRKDI